MSLRKIESGFSLMELLIVIVIIGILATVAVPTYKDYVAKTYVSAGYSSIQVIVDELVMTLNQTGTCNTTPIKNFTNNPYMKNYFIGKNSVLDTDTCEVAAKFKSAPDVPVGVADQIISIKVQRVDGNYLFNCITTLAANIQPKGCAYFDYSSVSGL